MAGSDHQPLASGYVQKCEWDAIVDLRVREVAA
jgi:hypothetical protein